MEDLLLRNEFGIPKGTFLLVLSIFLFNFFYTLRHALSRLTSVQFSTFSSPFFYTSALYYTTYVNDNNYKLYFNHMLLYVNENIYSKLKQIILLQQNH